MKLVWVLCFCLVGKLSATNPGAERAAAESNLGSGYMMAFPMNDDQLAEESAEAAVKTLAEAIVGSSDDDDDDDDEASQSETKAENKEPIVILDVEDDKKDDNKDESEAKVQNIEPMGILEAQLQEEEPQNPRTPRRPLFKRPKIEDLRKILGFPSADATSQKPKPIPLEKPKAFQTLFNKPKPKAESTPNGLQISLPLRREDRMRPFGFPMLPLSRNDNIRPFGFPDLVQAASSILRRAIIDDISGNDINKDDKDDESGDDEGANEEQDSHDEKDDDEDNDEDEPLMIVPIPDGKDEPMIRPPLFRRFPIPLPFPVPRPMPVSRPRLPVPPLTPVAFFLPLAQQIMNNIMARPAPRVQPPPMLPISPVHHLMPIHHPMQNFIPIFPFQHHGAPMQQHMVHVQQQPMIHIQQQPQPFQQIVPIHAPIFPIPQQAVHFPIFTQMPPNGPRNFMRPMQRRIPMPQPHPQMGRRAPMPNPMQQHHPMQQITPQLINPMMRRPVSEANTRPLQRMVRPPLAPVPSVILMMSPVPNNVPLMHQQQQQHIPVFHRPQQVPVMPQQISFMPQHIPSASRPMHIQVPVPQEEERVIFVREPDEQDDEQEVLLLVPTEETEAVQRMPAFMPRPMPRSIPSPIMNPLQRMKLLRELLMARQANRRAQMHPMAVQGRSPRIVEIVQQQLRIIPAHHNRGQQMQGHPSRADASELHPVYVPYPGPQ